MGNDLPYGRNIIPHNCLFWNHFIFMFMLNVCMTILQINRDLPHGRSIISQISSLRNIFNPFIHVRGLQYNFTYKSLILLKLIFIEAWIHKVFEIHVLLKVHIQKIIYKIKGIVSWVITDICSLYFQKRLLSEKYILKDSCH